MRWSVPKRMRIVSMRSVTIVKQIKVSRSACAKPRLRSMNAQWRLAINVARKLHRLGQRLAAIGHHAQHWAK
eukprot:6200076-Pleurochrysis_carterae.AAC.2